MRQSHRATPPYHRAVLVIHKQEVHNDVWTNVCNYNLIGRGMGLLNLQCCGGTSAIFLTGPFSGVHYKG